MLYLKKPFFYVIHFDLREQNMPKTKQSHDRDISEMDVAVINSEDGVINNDAYSRRSDLKAVRIAMGVTKIKDRAFWSCSHLTSVEIPDGVLEIGDCAFSDCPNLVSITIPNSVKKIGEAAFVNTGLTSLIFPERLEEIGPGALCDCKKITSVVIPENIHIVDNIFHGCSALESDIISKGVLLFRKRITSKIDIQNGVKKIGGHLFSHCKRIHSVIIPDGVKEIGKYAFWNCTNLTSVVIPKSVKKIERCAFRGCSKLTAINIPEDAIIEEGVFRECTALTFPFDVIKNGVLLYSSKQSGEIVIPDGVTKIGEYVFGGCKNITSVIFKPQIKLVFNQ